MNKPLTTFNSKEPHLFFINFFVVDLFGSLFPERLSSITQVTEVAKQINWKLHKFFSELSSNKWSGKSDLVQRRVSVASFVDARTWARILARRWAIVGAAGSRGPRPSLRASTARRRRRRRAGAGCASCAGCLPTWRATSGTWQGLSPQVAPK